MTKQLLLLACSLIVFSAAPATAAKAAPEKPAPGSPYRLTNSFRGSGECLEGNRADSPVHDGAAFMDKRQNVSGQLWKLEKTN